MATCAALSDLRAMDINVPATSGSLTITYGGTGEPYISKASNSMTKEYYELNSRVIVNTIKASYMWNYGLDEGTSSSSHARTGLYDVQSNYMSTATSATVTYGYDDRYAVGGWEVHGVQGFTNPLRPASPSRRLREIMASRAGPEIIIIGQNAFQAGQRKELPAPKNDAEVRARQTLKRIIGEKQFRAYLKKGFVIAQGKSGLIYQIFPNHSITNVFERGTMKERICIYLRGGYCPTDHVIMRYVMALHDEEEFRAKANTWSAFARKQRVQPAKKDNRSLTEIYAELKSQHDKSMAKYNKDMDSFNKNTKRAA